MAFFQNILFISLNMSRIVTNIDFPGNYIILYPKVTEHVAKSFTKYVKDLTSKCAETKQIQSYMHFHEFKTFNKQSNFSFHYTCLLFQNHLRHFRKSSNRISDIHKNASQY